MLTAIQGDQNLSKVENKRNASYRLKGTNDIIAYNLQAPFIGEMGSIAFEVFKFKTQIWYSRAICLNTFILHKKSYKYTWSKFWTEKQLKLHLLFWAIFLRVMTLSPPSFSVAKYPGHHQPIGKRPHCRWRRTETAGRPSKKRPKLKNPNFNILNIVNQFDQVKHPN